MRFFLSGFIVILLTSIVAASPSPSLAPGLTAIDELDGYAMVQFGPSVTRTPGAVLYSGRDLVLLDSDGDILPLAIPDDLSSFQYTSVTDTHLMGFWREAKGQRVMGYLELSPPYTNQWKTLTIDKGRLNYISFMHRLKDGRILFTDYSTMLIYVQLHPGGEYQSMPYPYVLNSMMAPFNFIESKQGVWIVPNLESIPDALRPRAMEGIVPLFPLQDEKLQDVQDEPPRAQHTILRLQEDGFNRFDLPPGSEPSSGLLLSESVMMVTRLNDPPLYLDVATGAEVSGVNVPLPQEPNCKVLSSSRAPDGDLWFQYGTASIFRNTTKSFKVSLYRWDGTTLHQELLDMPGAELSRTSYGSLPKPPRLLALGNKSAALCTSRHGLLLHKKGATEFIDWRYRMPALSVINVFAAGEDLYAALPGSRTIRIQPEKLVPDAHPSARLFQTASPMVADLEGDLWAIFSGEPATFSEWDGQDWTPQYDLPVATTNVGSFGFDTDNRLWLYDNAATTTVHVAVDGVWQHFEHRKRAYETFLDPAKPFYQPGLYGYHYGRNTPLFLKGEQVWFLDRRSNLHIYRDQNWTTIALGSAGLNAFSQPFLNPRGYPRIRQGTVTKAFHKGELLRVKGNPPKPGLTTTPGIRVNINTVNSYSKRNPRNFGDRGRIKLQEIDPMGVTWTVTDQGSLFASNGETVLSTSVIGTPIVSTETLGMTFDSRGGCFLTYQKTPSVTDWVFLVPDVPQLVFSCDVKLEPNRITLSVSESNFELDKFTLESSVDGGPWREGGELHSISQGRRKLTIRAKAEPGVVFVSEPLRFEVHVSGDLQALLDEAVEKLDNLDFDVRMQGAASLRAAGILARPWLVGCLNHPDPEVSALAQDILQGLL